MDSGSDFSDNDGSDFEPCSEHSESSGEEGDPEPEDVLDPTALDEDQAAENAWNPGGDAQRVVDVLAGLRANQRTDAEQSLACFDNQPIRSSMIWLTRHVSDQEGEGLFLHLKRWGRELLSVMRLNALDLQNLLRTNREYRNILSPVASGLRYSLASGVRCHCCYRTGRSLARCYCHPCNLEEGLAVRSTDYKIAGHYKAEVHSAGQPHITFWSDLEKAPAELASVLQLQAT
jgi:hypothetical protein